MATTQVQGISDLVTAVKGSNQVLGQLVAAIKAAFPQSLGTSATATTGAATLPANPAGFIEVLNPTTGATVKVPWYNL